MGCLISESGPVPEERLAMATMPGELMMRHRLTVDDYHQMAASGILGPDDRVELIAGEVLDMSRIGSLHAALVRALARCLADSVGPSAVVAVRDSIHLDDSSEPQPGIALLRPRPPAGWLRGASHDHARRATDLLGPAGRDDDSGRCPAARATGPETGSLNFNWGFLPVVNASENERHGK